MAPGSQGVPFTEWARALGLRAPIVCAPMGGVAGGALASAVSRAGGLGMIGMGSAASVTALERELAVLAERGTGGAPFGIGFVAWGVERSPELLDLALSAGPALISVSFLDWVDLAGGDSGGDGSGAGREPAAPEWLPRIKAAGALVVTQVATAEQARLAEALGFDAVVARGLEGGGHGEHLVERRRLLLESLEAVDLPVLAAGALHDAAGVEQVLADGAAAAWVGTAFSACTESLTPDEARCVLIEAEGSQTVVSRVLDVALGLPWAENYPERLLRTPFVDEWQGREAELAADAGARAAFREAYESRDYSVVPLDAGLGVGALQRVRTAAEVVDGLVGRDPR